MSLRQRAAEFFGRLFRVGVRPEGKQPSIEGLQKAIDYTFSHLFLLNHALTHKSCVGIEDKKGLKSNERLEFLGDAVVNCLVTEHLYKAHPDKTEGQLSKIKSLVVSRKILGEVASRIDIGKYLFLGHSERRSGGRRRRSILSNTFEALVGAVYLDGGLQPCRQILERYLFNRITEFLLDESNINFKSKILEMAQADGFGLPVYSVLSASGPDHAKEFHMQVSVAGIPLGEGTGANKKIAQQNAAQNAIKKYNREKIAASIQKGEA